jgi:excinuclease ABC subunit C
MQERLGEEMKKAAAAQEYERAAELRDLLSDLRRTTVKTNRFERVPYSLPQAISPERDLVELGEVLGLAGPPRRIEGFDISNISGTFKVASLVSFRDGRPDRSNYRRFRIKTVEGQDDFASMAEVVRRRYTRVLSESKLHSPEPQPADERATGEGVVPAELQRVVDDVSAAWKNKRTGRIDSDAAGADVRQHRAAGGGKGKVGLPDLIVIDGGSGQLGAALQELEKLGLTQLPVIGLAKEFEEIHRPGQKGPLRLSHESGALKLLQRVRDESHRLANTYNAQLRLRKISESLLDEFPNIGSRRKAALLKKFGSVQRIRMATIEQIAEVPGFGGKGAAELKTFLEARLKSTSVETTEESQI